MRLSEIGGEFGWIDRVRSAQAGASGDGLAVAIGDDAAVLDVPLGRQVVVTTDLLLEGVHFRRDWSGFDDIGWKAAAVSLSDIAAMGADPTFAFVSLAFGPDEQVEDLDALYRGLSDCLARYGARLAGGDTNRTTGGLVLNVAQLGTVPQGRAWTRAGGRAGDVLLVTGTLGDSAGGLALLTRLGADEAARLSPILVAAHRRPSPRLEAARTLQKAGVVRAAMDISDGLAGDLPKLCAASGCGAQVDLAVLPVSDALRGAQGVLGQSAAEVALAGGEDFELLLAVAPGDVDAARAAVAATGMRLTAIGELTPTGLTLRGPDGEARPFLRRGWDHFAP